ncbi:PD-(D/E)XK nuclease family transposase [Pontibacter sp. G13]|nr:PD-(D/E)XK nuclease family transposase [Pontibacter sp. G13]WNJ17737.1 PD-(D/E)XK nuclease family transposase [Pontibacter sp. G13]
MQEKYLNFMTDFAFKRILGESAHSHLLVHLLNALLPHRSPSISVTIHSSEHRMDSPEDRIAIFDIFLTNDRNAKFIFEAQRKPQEYFVKRAIFYAIRPIADQGRKGRKWDFNCQPVEHLGLRI